MFSSLTVYQHINMTGEDSKLPTIEESLTKEKVIILLTMLGITGEIALEFT